MKIEVIIALLFGCILGLAIVMFFDGEFIDGKYYTRREITDYQIYLNSTQWPGVSANGRYSMNTALRGVSSTFGSVSTAGVR